MHEALSAGRDHLRGVLEACFRDFCAGQHARDFVGASAVVEDTNLSLGAAVVFALLDSEMLIGEGSDLREVCNAENLLRAAESLELLADGFGGAASDSDIDFVEDQRAGRSLLSGFGR